MLALVGVFGLVIGSFLNVVIARLPEHRSLWRPRSACPMCGAAIAWHDNIPVLSYVALRGHCRACSAAIPWRYPVVEAATALLFGAAYERFGPTANFVVAAVLLAALLGGVVALVLLGSRATGRKDPIPFGPFLAAGGAAGLFCGERLVTWYMSAFAG